MVGGISPDLLETSQSCIGLQIPCINLYYVTHQIFPNFQSTKWIKNKSKLKGEICNLDKFFFFFENRNLTHETFFLKTFMKLK